MVAPLIGLVAAFVMMVVVYWIFKGATPMQMDVWFRKLQLVSAAALSFSHGTNDAQKTMGIITEVLLTAKIIPEFKVPIWVILSAHAAIAAGTFFGGWRIVHTLGEKGSISCILDWEKCTSNLAPEWELSLALHDLSIDEKQAFLEGYGLSGRQI